MTDMPRATLTVEEAGGSVATGTGICTVIAPCALHADKIPRTWVSTAALLAYHGFCDGVDYGALHVGETKKPIQFVGVPIDVPGAVSRVNTSGNTGSSVVSVSAGANGVMAEHTGKLTVITGGTVGTSQIVLGLSCDGARTTKRVKLGQNTSYTIPYLGVVLGFTVGTLVAGDTIAEWEGSSPLCDMDDLATVRANLAETDTVSRHWILIGDLQSSTQANAVLAQVNLYQTTHDRYAVCRASAYDRLPLAELSHTVARMSTATVTFANVSSTDTITRGSGSFVSDGFHSGGWIRITGSTSNNTSGIATVAASVLTFGATVSLTDEGPKTGVAITCETALTFGDNGASPDTLTRSAGSWIDDGFRVGDSFTVAGTASNNVTATITVITATVITVATGTFAAEVIGAEGVTVTKGQEMADWMTEINNEFDSVVSEERIDISAGRAWKLSLITGWDLPRPSSWAASIREHQHDTHIPVYKKKLGPCSGWDLRDSNDILAQYDERINGGALASGFTCFRSYNNTKGTFLALSLTRGDDGALLSRTHNMHTVNLLCAVAHAAAEDFLGETPDLNADGTMTSEELGDLTSELDGALTRAGLVNTMGEGKRVSSVKATIDPTAKVDTVGAILPITIDIKLRGTIEQVTILVRVA